MPRNNRRHQHANTGNNLHRPISGEISRFRQPRSPETPSKSTPKFFPLLLLQALVMAFVISLFFVFVGVAAVIFLHLCLAGGALRRRRHQRRNLDQPNSGGGDSSSGYSPEELNTLPKCRFRGSEICSICLDDVLEGDICRVLPSCKHVFHLNCVDKWLMKSSACPVCRNSVRLSNSNVEGKDVLHWERLWAACG